MKSGTTEPTDASLPLSIVNENISSPVQGITTTGLLEPSTTELPSESSGASAMEKLLSYSSSTVPASDDSYEDIDANCTQQTIPANLMQKGI